MSNVGNVEYRKVKRAVEKAWDDFFDSIEESLKLPPSQLSSLAKAFNQSDVYNPVFDKVVEVVL